MFRRLTAALFRPIDMAWLVLLRIGTGLLLAGEHLNGFLAGRVLNYTAPRFHLRYQLLEWLPAVPPWGIYALYVAVLLSGVAVALGWRYRLAAAVLGLGYLALLVLEETEYINHYYLYTLLAAVLLVLPAHRAASLDVRAGRVPPATAVPAWARVLVLFQISIVYLFAALAKLNPDWMEARPLMVWLTAKASRPIIGPLLTWPVLPWLMSYGGLVFDALVVPALLWRPTRPWAFGLAVFFHLSNVAVFTLATFPWMALLLTTLYFAPDFPRRLPGRLGRWFRAQVPRPAGSFEPISPARQRWIMAGLYAYAVLQLALPLRHFLYPGDTHWTEEGHRFSWHLMLRAKEGTASFRVLLPGGRQETVAPQDYLTPNQYRKLVHSPDMLLEFAHLLAADYRRRGLVPTAVYCDSQLSLNGHPPRPLVSPQLNLLRERRHLGHYAWVLPGPVK